LSHHWGFVGVLLSAILFGVSTTLNKIALTNTNPILIAGLSYFSAGLLLLIIHYSPFHPKLLSLFETTTPTEHEIAKKDYKILGLIILFGSVIAPLMLLQGLKTTTAVNTSLLLSTESFFTALSLLLSTESFFTALIAFTFLRERGTKKEYTGILLLIIGVIFLTTNANFQEINLTQSITGNILVVGACVFWGVDNNLSKSLSKKTEIIYITGLKCLIGGTILLSMPLFLNIKYEVPLVSLPYILSVGALSIALSILLFLFALREIGSMRTGAIFSVSSLFGAIFAFFALGESFSIVQLLSGVIMLFGVYVLCIKPSHKT